MRNALLPGIIGFVVLLISFQIATQYAAYEFNYPDNGHYVNLDDEIRIYPPYQIIWWMYVNQMNKSLEPVFKKASDILFLGLLVAMCLSLFFIMKKKMKKKNSYSHGDASWMTSEELKKTGNLDGDGVVLCQESTAKIKIVNPAKNTLKIKKAGALITDDAPTHNLIIAPTRGGKGVGTVIPTLLHWKQSVFCYDIKRENYQLTAGYRNLFSTVLKFDPAIKESLKWNPLEEIRINTINEVSDSQMIGEILMNPDGDKLPSDIWFAFAKKLATGLILYLINSKDEDKSITGLYKILSSETTVVDKLKSIVAYDTGKPGINSIMKSYLYEFIQMADSEKQFAGAISSTLQSLELYLDPIVSNNTSSSDFKLKDLMNSEYPVSLYYCIPPSAEARMRPLTRLMISCLLMVTTESLSLEEEKKPNYRLLMMIDEFPSLGKLEIVEKALAYVAGYGIKIYLIVQSITQLNKIYTKDNSIVDNCHIQMFYATNRIEVAKEISDRCGKTTELVESVSTSGQRTELFDKGHSRSTSEISKALISPEDVMKLPYTDAILFINGQKPYMAKKNVFYSDTRFKEKVKIKPPIQFDIEYLLSNQKRNQDEVIADQTSVELTNNSKEEEMPIIDDEMTKIELEEEINSALEELEEFDEEFSEDETELNDVLDDLMAKR